MGALLLTDGTANLNEMFVPDHEVVGFETIDELLDKIRYYSRNDAERERIARSGQERTLKDHSSRVRARELERVFNKYL